VWQKGIMFILCLSKIRNLKNYYTKRFVKRYYDLCENYEHRNLRLKILYSKFIPLLLFF